MSQQFQRLPIGRHHLDVIHKNKFVARYPSKAKHPTRKFVQPKDRIKRWNIVPGDRVRLLVGTNAEKYNDEDNKSSGSKVYTVAQVDMERNRVFLNGITNKKPNPIRPIPDNIDELDADTRKSLLEQRNFIDVRRSVQYSNLQLCVKEDGAESIFATRIKTTAPRFNFRTRRWEWKRIAAKVTGDVAGEPQTIAWPQTEEKKKIDPTPWDTTETHVREKTVVLASPESIPDKLIPTSMRAPPPKDQAFADEYIFNPSARHDPLVEAAMPLYLGEELSPRFSRAKKQRGWRLRRELEESHRVQKAKSDVDAWEAGGRDEGIEEVLDLDIVGLDGVKIRNRTRKEVREAALSEVDEEIKAARQMTERARAAGQVFLQQQGADGEWVDGPKGLDLARRRARKERKERRTLEKLANLSLQERKNQVIPPDLRA